MKFSELQAKIRQAAKLGQAEDLIIVNKTLAAVEAFLSNNQFVSPAKVALEHFEGPWLIDNRDAVETVDPSAYITLAAECGITNERMQLAVAIEAARCLSGESNSMEAFFNSSREGNLTPLSNIVGPTAATNLLAEAKSAMESFGVDMNNVASDARAALFVSIMRGHKSLIDRLLPRVSKDSSVVTVKVDNPRIYDLAKSADKSSDVRNGGDHEKPLIHLFTKPEMADTSAKKIVPLKANDVNGDKMLDSALRTGVVCNLFDLASTSATVGVDYSDFVGEGARVENLILKVTRTAKADGAKTEEFFQVQTGFLGSARFVHSTNNNDSSERIALVEAFQTLTKGSKTAAGGASVILGGYQGHTVRLSVGLTGKLNRRTSDVVGQGSINVKLVADAGGDVAAPIAEDFSELSFEVVAYNVDARYSEENLRRTTAAVRLLTFEKSFEIPVARSHVVEYSLQQETPQQVIDTVSTVISHGNSHRALGLIEDTIRDVAARNAYEDKNTDLPDQFKVNRDFVAGTKCNPRVYVGTLNLAKDNVVVRSETERMSDLHSYVVEHLTAVIAGIHEKSLYPVQLNEGEKPVYKVVTSGTIKDILFGVKNYYNHLDDEVDGGAGKAEYSLRLPSGVRLDIHTTAYEYYSDKIMLLPIRENNETELTSFGQNLDRGTWAGNYTATHNGAAVKRAVVNAREMPWITNPVAVLVKVENLDEQLSSLNKG